MTNIMSSQMYKNVRSGAFRFMMIFMIPFGFFLYAMFRSLSGPAYGCGYTGISTLRHALDGDFFFMIVGILSAIIFCLDYSSTSIRQIIGKGIDRTKYTLGSIITTFLTTMLPISLLYVTLFVIGSVHNKDMGPITFMDIVWLILCSLSAAFCFTSFNMVIASLSKKTSITVICAILSPTLVRLTVLLIGTLIKKDLPLDPIAAFTTIIDEGVPTATRLANFSGFMVMGLIFTGLSIMIVRKKDL